MGRKPLDVAIAIKDFVKMNRVHLLGRIKTGVKDPAKKELMIRRLNEIPEPFLCQSLEIDLLLDEVLRGGLEWLYQDKIEGSKIGDMVKETGHRLLEQKDAEALEALNRPSGFWKVSVLRTRYY